MTGRILVVDAVATNRIIMKVKLAAACYHVEQVASGRDALAAARELRPDLIVLDVSLPDMPGLDVCRQLKTDTTTAEIPVILVGAETTKAAVLRGLEAGAEEYFSKPLDDVSLLARVRSLLRSRDVVRDLHARGEGLVPMGFGEAAAQFGGRGRPGHIAVVAPSAPETVAWKSRLDAQVDHRMSVLPREAALSDATRDASRAPDVFILSADMGGRGDGFHLLSDLQSRAHSRHAAVIMILPTGDRDRAATALDLGASDVIFEPVDPRELAIRVRSQLRRKRRADHWRATLRAGLELAVTDSLTGLHNRLYALHKLEQMMAHPGRGVSVMMLDLDHFKAINDRFGHSFGDRVLQMVARRLRAQMRAGDLLARIGGEEFLVALPDDDRPAALDCAERLRDTVARTLIDPGTDREPVRVTLSVGLALVPPDAAGETPQQAIARADRALYGSKSDGRDQVTLAALPAA